MKLIRSFWIIVCLSVPFAAQAGARQRDVIGAHINYGRGCSTCHVPHTSGVRNPEGSSSDVFMLWGEDVSTTYNADGEVRLYAGIPAESPENRGLLMCVTCHAGDYAQAAMLKNST